MLFVIDCTDAADGLAKRTELRPLHLEHLRSVKKDILTAGPKLKDGKPVGSVLIINFADRKTAESFVAADPYKLGGVFAAITVNEYKRVF